MYWVSESLVQSDPSVKLTTHLHRFSKSENIYNIASMTSIRLLNVLLPFLHLRSLKTVEGGSESE
jgi:hypothetical protein